MHIMYRYSKYYLSKHNTSGKNVHKDPISIVLREKQTGKRPVKHTPSSAEVMRTKKNQMLSYSAGDEVICTADRTLTQLCQAPDETISCRCFRGVPTGETSKRGDEGDNSGEYIVSSGRCRARAEPGRTSRVVYRTARADKTR